MIPCTSAAFALAGPCSSLFPPLAAGVKIPRKPVAAMPHPLRAEPGAPENVRPAVSFKDFKTEPEASELEAKALQRIGHFVFQDSCLTF